MHSSYRDLLAWQKAMDLVDVISTTVRTFPSYELYGLSSQMRRAAYSVPLNIAEGRGRSSYRDFRLFLRRARTSILELETAIEIARRQGYLTTDGAEALFKEALRVVQLINGLIRNLTARIRAGDRRPATGDRNRQSSP